MLDVYTLKARVWPGFIAGLPAAAVVGIAFPSQEWWHSGLLGTGVVTAALTFLLAQIARSAGKAKEPRLFKLWGGKPTTRYLRHRHSPLDANTIARYHRNIERLSPALKMPSAAEERADSRAADGAYDAASRMLISKTRDTKRFPLLFKENVHYGFCRNLWGLKPLAIGIAVLASLACGALGIQAHLTHGLFPLFPIVVGVLSVISALLWSIWFRPNWVKVPADAYAERLLEASDVLVVDLGPGSTQ